MKEISLRGERSDSIRNRQMLAMASAEDVGRGVHVASPRDKVTVQRLEKAGLVTVERTKEKCAGYNEWWVSLTPKGREKWTEHERTR
jgi:DNA-binding MarR family transcriptional regulator